MELWRKKEENCMQLHSKQPLIQKWEHDHHDLPKPNQPAKKKIGQEYTFEKNIC